MDNKDKDKLLENEFISKIIHNYALFVGVSSTKFKKENYGYTAGTSTAVSIIANKYINMSDLQDLVIYYLDK